MSRKVTYQKVNLSEVINAYADGFIAPEGEKFPEFGSKAWFVDPTKGVVIFELYTEVDK